MRNILITGASSGFGACIARKLVAQGHTVVGTSRRATMPDALRMGQFNPATLDVNLDSSVQALKQRLQVLGFTPEVLILNAGFGIAGSLEETSSSDAKGQFETNFFGVHRMVAAYLPLLRQQGDARIIVIGSLAGIVSIPFQGLYCASKFALEGYIDALILEAGMHGVQATLIQPGDFNTGFSASRAAPPGRTDSPYEPVMSKTIAIIAEHERRGGDPRLVANRVSRLVAGGKLKARYKLGSVGERAVTALAGILPRALLQAVVRAVYKVPRRAGTITKD
jgi:short-subunit dehydrogenase